MCKLWAPTHSFPPISRQRDWTWAVHLVTHFPLTVCKSCHFGCLRSERDVLDCNWRISNSPSPFLFDVGIFWQMQAFSLSEILSNMAFLFSSRPYIWDLCQFIVKSWWIVLLETFLPKFFSLLLNLLQEWCLLSLAWILALPEHGAVCMVQSYSWFNLWYYFIT